MKHSILGAACATLLIAASGAAQASLIDRGGGLIYDTDLNITWLADANYAMTSGYDTDGAMTWASNLSYYDSVRNVTYTDWRLPTTLLPDPTCEYNNAAGSFGYYCTGSEMGHLFYNELGGAAGYTVLESIDPQTGQRITDPDLALFTNVLILANWSGSEFEPVPDSSAWYFNFNNGYQDPGHKDYNLYAWAVRPGDVAAVPLPGAVWLFGSGLLGLVGLARRKRIA